VCGVRLAGFKKQVMTVVAKGIKLGEVPSSNTQALANGHNDDG
jgi:hypothetical protein